MLEQTVSVPSNDTNYYISNYAGETITVRLSVILRSHPVNETIFRAQTVELWATQS